MFKAGIPLTAHLRARLRAGGQRCKTECKDGLLEGSGRERPKAHFLPTRPCGLVRGATAGGALCAAGSKSLLHEGYGGLRKRDIGICAAATPLESLWRTPGSLWPILVPNTTPSTLGGPFLDSIPYSCFLLWQGAEKQPIGAGPWWLPAN